MTRHGGGRGARASRRKLTEHFGMQFRDPNQRLCRSARCTPSLFPLLQGALRDSEQSGELRLGQAGFQTRANDGRTGLNRSPFATASLDFTHAVQDLLPDITVRLESGERTSGEFLGHVRTPPSVASEYGPARSPASPWHTMPASRTRSAIAREVDRAQPATLACAFTPPTEFPYPARAANHRSRFRVLHHELRQLAVFIVIEVAGSHAIEGSRLDKHEHTSILRLWRTSVKHAPAAIAPTAPMADSAVRTSHP